MSKKIFDQIEEIDSRIAGLERLVTTPITNEMMYRLEIAKLKATRQQIIDKEFCQCSQCDGELSCQFDCGECLGCTEAEQVRLETEFEIKRAKGML